MTRLRTCDRCGAVYGDDDAGIAGHKVVFGHTPVPKGAREETAP